MFEGYDQTMFTMNRVCRFVRYLDYGLRSQLSEGVLMLPAISW